MRLDLWTSMDTGLKSRFHPLVKAPAVNRDILEEATLEPKLERGSILQEARLRRYPSIDVNFDELFAGYIVGDLDDATDKLNQMGYRNNPTAYVEVTEELGPDDGSYARQIVTESGVGFDRPILHSQPTLFRREKRQVHVCAFVVESDTEEHEMFDEEDNIVVYLAHEEQSAWLQPMRHVAVPDGEGEIGVRMFRNDWWNEFEEELDGKEMVNWEVAK